MMNANDKLEKIISYVSEHVPYYKKYNSLSDIEELPIMTKDVIRNGYDYFISDEIKNRDELVEILNSNVKNTKGWYNEVAYTNGIIIEETSGTSGIPFLCMKTREERNRLALSMWKERIKRNRKLSPSTLFQFSHIGMGKKNPNAYDYSPKHLEVLYEDVCKGNYIGIHGTPNAFNNHIDSIIKNKIDIDVSKIEYIECTGSYLKPEIKEKIAKYFNAEVINEYGTIETWPIGFSIDRCDEIEINNDAVYLELLDETNGVINEVGVVGRVVITSLYCKSLPFIRYSLGDFAEYVELNNANKTIRLMEGREVNLIKGISRRVFGNQFFNNVVKTIKLEYPDANICYIQIIQEKQDLLCVRINQIRDIKRFTELFCNHIRTGLGKDFTVTISILSDEEIDARKYDKPNIFLCRC